MLKADDSAQDLLRRSFGDGQAAL